MNALVRAMRGSATARQALLGVKGDALAAATAANASVRTGLCRPAIDRYTGVLYDALDAASLGTRDRRRLDERVRIFSGCFGLVAPADPIPDYKLKMGASLPRLAKLSTAWRPLIDAELNRCAEGRTVWDLLPNEHAAAWTGAVPGGMRIRVRFLDDVERRAQRSLVTVSHWNKLLKGALVRHLLATGLNEPAGLEAFDHPEGYRYRPDLDQRSVGAGATPIVTVHLVADRST